MILYEKSRFRLPVTALFPVDQRIEMSPSFTSISQLPAAETSAAGLLVRVNNCTPRDFENLCNLDVTKFANRVKRQETTRCIKWLHKF